jgi:hypothetical protein
MPKPQSNWMNNAPGPFVQMKPGGPLDPVVEIATADAGHLRITASWTSLGDRRTLSETVANDYDAARLRVHLIADQLAIGREPE